MINLNAAVAPKCVACYASYTSWLLLITFFCCVTTAFAAPQKRAQTSVPKTKVAYKLMIQLTPAACMTTYGSVDRACLQNYWLTVQDFRIERSNGSALPEHCGNHTLPPLSPIQASLLGRIIPSPAVRERIWRTGGACTGLSATDYFRLITTSVNRLKVPDAFRPKRTVMVSRQLLRQQMRSLNPSLPEQGFYFQCTPSPQLAKPLLSSIHICYRPDGAYSTCPFYANRLMSCGDVVAIQGLTLG